jgi:phosphate/sulfate permease
MVGVEVNVKFGVGSEFAKYMWVYIIFPFVGAIFAAVFFVAHQYIDKNEYNQKEPVQFIGLLKSRENSQIMMRDPSQNTQQQQPNLFLSTNSQII